VQTPVVAALKQNYPNPFNPETNIVFEMAKGGNATLSVYNTKGQLVRTLCNTFVTKGVQKYTWNGSDTNGNRVASGLYFYRLTTNGNVETKKMMLLK
jgi:flagellar hook assembly protein FlgD